MATLSKADSRRMYSWWWNSHISPKNSKWLQENLTDMDIKVKSMIKLIEEDADSFARRAEMYYKKRPELMKLVEEFYRAYRALAERYDHASGALRQAQKTITEAFPNQVPLLPDDALASPASDGDPQTPEMRTSARTLFDFDEFQKDYSDEKSDVSQKGLKQLNELVGSKGIVRKGLKFHDSEESNKNHKSQARVNDKEIILLKDALAKVEDEKKAGLKQYQGCLDRLSKLESEISHAQRDSRELTERAIKAEDEAQTLKDALQRLEAEKEESLNLYSCCLDKISNLENALSRAQINVEELNDQVKSGENVAQNLKNDITRLEDEKNAAQSRYNHSLKMISDLEMKLRDAEEEARKFSVHAEKAELEVETLKQTVAKLTEKKEEQALLYQQCLEIISSLELKLSCAQEEAERLNGEIDSGVAMLKGAEEQCLMLKKSNHSLHSELESMVLKMGAQTQDLTKKEKEMGRLGTCIQEEHLRFVEAETAFQTLQHLHSQTQEELTSLASELQNRAQVLRDMETRNQDLQVEIQTHKEENKNLNELNLSSAISLEDMQSQISSLKESRKKLQEEVELQVDQRTALQQEMYGLKEELNELNKNHGAILEQVAYTGLNPECFGSLVKELQDENSKLKEESKTERSEKAALLEKLNIMGQLLEKNALLENSLSNLGVALEGARGEIKTLEDSYRFLFEEKSTLAGEKDSLLSQLQVTTESLSEVSEKNNILENSLFDAHVELELLKQKSKNFEDSCQVLADEKSMLISEKSTLVSQMEIAEKSLKDLELRYADLEGKYSSMEKERESTLRAVAELHVSLAVQNQEHATFAQMNERELKCLRSQIQFLQEENHNRCKEFDIELDKALGSEIEIFILLRCVHDLEEHNFSLLSDCQKLQEASRLSESLIHELKQEKNDNHIKIQSLADQNNTWRTGMHQLLKIAGICLKSGPEDGQEQTSVDRIRSHVETTNHALVEMAGRNMELLVEMTIMVTLLSQLKTEVADLEAEKDSIFQESMIRAEKILELQSEAQKLLKTNKELRSRVSEGDHKEETLRNQLESLHGEFSIVQGAYRSLQMQNSVVLEEKRALAKNNLQMEEEIRILEEENYTIFDEVLCQSNLSILLEKYLDEKYTEINWLCGDLQKLHGVNVTISEKMSMVETKLEALQMENLHLKQRLEKSEHELESVVSVHDKLNSELVNGKNLLHLKEKEHMEAAQQVANLENEKAELSMILVGLQKEYDEVKTTRDEQGKQILELSEENDHLSKEYMCLGESSRLLEIKMHQLCEEQERTKNREETLCFELQKERDEIQFLETHASAVYSDLQTSILCQAIFEEKVHELTDVCLSLQEEDTSKQVNIELLKERACNLEHENEDLKTHLASYGPPLIYLRDCILSLENHICISSTEQKSHDEGAKCAEMVNHTDQDQDTMGTDTLTILQDLQNKVKTIEIAVLEMEKLSEQKLDADAKLEAALRQIEELRYNTSSQRKYDGDAGLEPKDILLDQASECSSYGISKREFDEGDIWEKADQSGHFDINVENKKVVNYEKENKRKFVERLNSDVQKLTNLQITIDGIKRKLEITKKSRRGKATVESENLKGQLVEAETDIEKMFELNVKLVKHLEGEKSTTELEESQSQQRVSEKIGQLQLEVQKIQFLLLKMDKEKEVKGKSRFLDSKRVFLKDGKTKATISSSKRKKCRFCACIEPPTKGGW